MLIKCSFFFYKMCVKLKVFDILMLSTAFITGFHILFHMRNCGSFDRFYMGRELIRKISVFLQIHIPH